MVYYFGDQPYESHVLLWLVARRQVDSVWDLRPPRDAVDPGWRPYRLRRLFGDRYVFAPGLHSGTDDRLLSQLKRECAKGRRIVLLLAGQVQDPCQIQAVAAAIGIRPRKLNGRCLRSYPTKLIPTARAARLLGVSQARVRQLFNAGRLRGVKMPGKNGSRALMVHLADVQARRLDARNGRLPSPGRPASDYSGG